MLLPSNEKPAPSLHGFVMRVRTLYKKSRIRITIYMLFVLHFLGRLLNRSISSSRKRSNKARTQSDESITIPETTYPPSIFPFQLSLPPAQTHLKMRKGRKQISHTNEDCCEDNNDSMHVGSGCTRILFFCEYLIIHVTINLALFVNFIAHNVYSRLFLTLTFLPPYPKTVLM